VNEEEKFWAAITMRNDLTHEQLDRGLDAEFRFIRRDLHALIDARDKETK
jgi:hypothetical protein